MCALLVFYSVHVNSSDSVTANILCGGTCVCEACWQLNSIQFLAIFVKQRQLCDDWSLIIRPVAAYLFHLLWHSQSNYFPPAVFNGGLRNPPCGVYSSELHFDSAAQLILLECHCLQLVLLSEEFFPLWPTLCTYPQRFVLVYELCCFFRAASLSW